MVLIAIIQSIAISLGVGCSTLAIVNFFVAIADGKIDENERRMMGIVYVLLRIAMILIVTSSLILSLYYFFGRGEHYISAFAMGMWILIVMLFINSFLMTKHIMPSTIGPALQASTWYTLGILMALVPLGLGRFSYFEFIVGYLAAIALAVSVVNGTMSYLKSKKV